MQDDDSNPPEKLKQAIPFMFHGKRLVTTRAAQDDENDSIASLLEEKEIPNSHKIVESDSLYKPTPSPQLPNTDHKIPKCRSMGSTSSSSPTSPSTIQQQENLITAPISASNSPTLLSSSTKVR